MWFPWKRWVFYRNRFNLVVSGRHTQIHLPTAAKCCLPKPLVINKLYYWHNSASLRIMYALSWATWEERLNRLKGSRDVTKNALVRYFYLVSFSEGKDPVFSVIFVHFEVHVERGERLTPPLCDSLAAQKATSETSNIHLTWAFVRRWSLETCFWETLQGDSYT